MPPVRWKRLFTVTSLLLVQLMACTDAHLMQDSISMTSDGWRPIVGSGSRNEPIYHDEILHYRNPSQRNGESVKAETYPPTTSTQAPSTATPLASSAAPPKPSRPPGKPTVAFQVGKVPLHSKPQMGHYFGLPNMGHGPHIPLGAVTHGRPGQHGIIKKFPTSSKPFVHMAINGKRHMKPLRVQAAAHSSRDEIFATSPSSGAYAFYKPGPISNIKPRETAGLGLPGGSHYSVNQPHAHIEFTNRFAAPPPTPDNGHNGLFPHPPFGPVQGFIFPKHPHSNDVSYPFHGQSDEYTRNLVPPPFLLKEQTNPGNDKLVRLVNVNGKQEGGGVQAQPAFEIHRLQKVTKTPPVQVQITKEKLNVFHNHIPSTYTGDYVDYDYHTVRNPTDHPTRQQTYEVTEGQKPWADVPPHFAPRPRKPLVLRPLKRRPPEVQLNLPPFLPTPYRPEGQGIVPTLPTQSEVSTIFTKLSQLQKDRAESSTPNPSQFDVKEVSTHYPILGKPNFDYEAQTQFGPMVPMVQEVQSNDITTAKPEEFMTTTTTQPPPPPPPPQPPRIRPSPPSMRRRRPGLLRTKPTMTTTTTTTPEVPFETVGYELQRNHEEAVQEVTSEENVPRHRYKTTTQVYHREVAEAPVKVHNSRGRNRLRVRPATTSGGVDLDRPATVKKRLRPTTTELPSNHKLDTTEIYSGETAEEEEEEEGEEFEQMREYVKRKKSNEMELPGRHYPITTTTEEEPIQTLRYENILQSFRDHSEEQQSSTTERQPTTNLHLPENEVDPTVRPTSTEYVPPPQEEATIATTEASTTTSRPSRIRGRPIKYDNSNRPRFSVKDYRQKLNQLSSTSTTTEPTFQSKRTSSEGPKVRFPNRARRPLSSSSTTTSGTPSAIEESSTESGRAKFVPKDPRHGANDERSDNIITEKNVKAVNTRLRPFSRFRSTTPSTTAVPKVSIKPNLFTRRRPAGVSLRMKIFSKNQKNNTRTTPEDGAKADRATTTARDDDEDQTTVHNMGAEDSTEESGDAPAGEPETEPETTTADILKNEAYLYSQRVSDLTSSSKNEYDTPGLFKSVAPTSRRIPNYFTIATDDPILPIEAFFPNIKDKDKE